MLYNLGEVEAIKLAVKNMENVNVSSKDTLLKSIQYLEENYVLHQKDEYLQKAVWHIYAYIELGFSYDDGKGIFEKVIRHYGTTYAELIYKRQWKCQKIILNKTNIRNILGRWNPILQSMKIEDVVSDIILRVSNKETGEYLYHCGKCIETVENRKLWEHTFKLHVTETVSFILDINKSKYYVFKENDRNDKNSSCR